MVGPRTPRRASTARLAASPSAHLRFEPHGGQHKPLWAALSDAPPLSYAEWLQTATRGRARRRASGSAQRRGGGGGDASLVAVERVRAVSVEGAKGAHVHGEVDADDFLWSKLPGRCCFEVKEICPFEKAPRSMCKHYPPDTCRACGVWSTPED